LKETLDSLIREIVLTNPVGFDTKYYRQWVFEYACQTAEHEHKVPYKCPDYLNFLMVMWTQKVRDQLVGTYHKQVTTSKGTKQIRVKLLSLDSIPYLVQQEHYKKP